MRKRWIITAGVALALGAAATVAVAERGEKMREHRQGMPFLGRLDLTDEQREQLQALREEHREARREHRETMAAMARKQREAVMGVLTDEQQETLKEMRGRFFDRRGGRGWDRGDMRRGGRGWRGDMGRPGRGWHDARQGVRDPFSRLDLTDEQKERLEELRTEHRTEMGETRTNHRKALEGVLTDGQREKLETMRTTPSTAAAGAGAASGNAGSQVYHPPPCWAGAEGQRPRRPVPSGPAKCRP